MITLQNKPQLYSPLNLALFKVISDRATILLFRVQIIDALTNTIITNQKYATIPMIDKGTSFDLAPILSSFVQPQIVNTNQNLEPTPKQIRAYKLKITEVYLNVDLDQTDGDELTTDVFNVFSADLGRLDFTNYNYTSFVANTGAKNVFLTKKPLKSRLYYSDSEFLYFLAGAECYVKITYFNVSGALISTSTYNVDAIDKVYRVDISPKNLTFTNTSPFTNVFQLPFRGNGGAQQVYSFTVELTDISGVNISEVRTYYLDEDTCGIDYTQIFFTNSLGGFDSMPFFYASQSVTTDRTTLEPNKYQYDINGDYSDIVGGVYNPDTVIIKNTIFNSFSLISKPLKDSDSLLAKYLMSSKEVYVRLKNNRFLPITVDAQEYIINKTKYNTNNYRLNLKFKIQDVDLDLSK